MSSIPVILRLLKDLTANNNREWFNKHQGEYEIAHIESGNSLSPAIVCISLSDENIRGIQLEDCAYRIYRDARFSSDKTLYKNHFGGYTNTKGKKSNHSGCYIHI